MAEDADYRQQVAARPLRCQAKRLKDGELLAKLHCFGIDLDRSSLAGLCQQSLSAEEIAKPLLDKCTFKTKEQELEGDWIWICLDALWQRWLPIHPSFEMLDDKIQAGYELLESKQVAAAGRIWLEAWNDLLQLLNKSGIESIGEFDNRFNGTQAIFNWIQDLESELWNAGLEDRRFLIARIACCEEGLRRFEAEDDLLIENCRRALAESYYELGEVDKVDALYQEWLKSDRQWGWGWIGWSDCYQFTRTEFSNLDKAEKLLREGISIAGVRDFQDIAERLADLYQEQERIDEAKQIRQQGKMRAEALASRQKIVSGDKVQGQKGIITSRDDGLLFSDLPQLANFQRSPTGQIIGNHDKVGRNEPCPCGSGRKFKKCCANNR